MFESTIGTLQTYKDYYLKLLEGEDVTQLEEMDVRHFQVLYNLLLLAESDGRKVEYGLHCSNIDGPKEIYVQGREAEGNRSAEIRIPKIDDKSAVFFHTHPASKAGAHPYGHPLNYLPSTFGSARQETGDLANSMDIMQGGKLRMGGFLNILTRKGAGIYLGRITMNRAELFAISTASSWPNARKLLGRWQLIAGNETVVGETFFPPPYKGESKPEGIGLLDENLDIDILDPNKGAAVLRFEQVELGLHHYFLALDINTFFSQIGALGVTNLLYHNGLDDLVRQLGYRNLPGIPGHANIAEAIHGGPLVGKYVS